MENYRTDIYN